MQVLTNYLFTRGDYEYHIILVNRCTAVFLSRDLMLSSGLDLPRSSGRFVEIFLSFTALRFSRLVTG